MRPPTPLDRLAAYLLITSIHLVSAHSHIAYLIINNKHYPGFDPSGRTVNPAHAVGWSTTAGDDGFVPPSNYSAADIICHRDGAPAHVHAPVRQGDRIHVQWNGWPSSHHGPVLSYLAPCANANANANTTTEDGCASVDKTQLRWTKIDSSTPVLIDQKEDGPPGKWATDLLIASNNSWLVGIPRDLEPGPYVLRHEIIALHYADKKDGAQNYPQCVNLWVEGKENGNGNATAIGEGGGIPATKLYQPTDPGVAINIYSTLSTYVVPGPTVVPWAEPVPLSAQKQLSAPLMTGTPVAVVDGTRTVPFAVAQMTGGA